MHQNDAPDEPSETTEEMMAAGSYGQEIQEDVTLEGLEGEDATHDARAPEERQHGSLNEKASPSTTGTNPKRTENSRAD